MITLVHTDTALINQSLALKFVHTPTDSPYCEATRIGKNIESDKGHTIIGRKLAQLTIDQLRITANLCLV